MVRDCRPAPPAVRRHQLLFIDTFNARPARPQQGAHLGALLVSARLPPPSAHATYAGNRPDAGPLQPAHRALPRHHRLSNPSPWSSTKAKANLAAVETSPFHFRLVPTPTPICSPPLPTNLASDGPGVRARRASAPSTASNAPRRHLQHSTRPRPKPCGVDRHARPALVRCSPHNSGVGATGRSQAAALPDLQGVTGKDGWLRARMRDLFSVEIGEEGGLPTLTYAFNEAAWQDLRATLLGKTLLFHDWSDADIVRGAPSTISKGPSARPTASPCAPNTTDQCAAADQFAAARHGLHARSTPCSSNSVRSAIGLLHPPHGSHGKPRLQSPVERGPTRPLRGS